MIEYGEDPELYAVRSWFEQLPDYLKCEFDKDRAASYDWARCEVEGVSDLSPAKYIRRMNYIEINNYYGGRQCELK